MHRSVLRVCLSCGLVFLAASARAQTAGSPEDLTGESAAPLQITGFGVGDYQADGRSRDNTFDAGKLAVSMFRELSPRLWVFGQLTTSVDASSGESDEAVTSIEIDNFIVNVTPPGSSISVSFGKFDTPIGFERDDEPLDLQATVSDNFTFARPSKMVGAIGRWTASPHLELSAWIANGWQSDLEPNHGKTVGARAGWVLSERGTVGVAALYGPEGPQGEARNRHLVTLDYAFQPTDAWIVAGEGNYGGDTSGAGAGGTQWYGATATVFHRIARSFGAAGRVEGFRDRDGARTGTSQTLSSVTLTPMYFFGTGGNGIFANIEHTTFRIPRFQLRGDIRWDRARAIGSGANVDQSWRARFVAQLVATF